MIKTIEFQPGNGFIGHYQTLVKDTVIPYQYQVMQDQIPDIEKSHVIQNFINAGKTLRGEDNTGFYGMVFQDSDAAKWLEAVAYSLKIFPDAQLEVQADALIGHIEAAQDFDGYLNTYYTIKDQDKRWTNLFEGHELYCSGHMMEAACAYYETTGKDRLLKVMIKNMAHIYEVFIQDKHPGYPGHPEIELALMRLYHITKDNRALTLAKHFIDVRGVDTDFYKTECASRDWYVWGKNAPDLNYMQASKPVREQTDAVGHAVRAVYLYTGMADLALATKDLDLKKACEQLFTSIAERQLYITGGIGSTVLGEAFSVDYDLPNDTAYAETCASIGLIFFASKLLALNPMGHYGDIMEQAFYNTVLAGMQLDGERFFYVNPLEVVPGISGIAPTHKHALPNRPNWYACACCPPNAARLIAGISQFAYSQVGETAYCHLFLDGTTTFLNGLTLMCDTKYPHDLTVTYQVLSGTGTMALRIPAWSPEFALHLNGQALNVIPKDGYVLLTVQPGDQVTLALNETPYFVYASTKVPKLTGQVALCRGPLVYAFEGVDNQADVLSLVLKEDGLVTVLSDTNETLGGIKPITVEAYKVVAFDGLYTRQKPKIQPYTATAVPYYTWGNRGENQMRVWMPRMF